MSSIRPTLGCPCGGRYLETAFTYDAPPRGETRFGIAGEYRRAYDRCGLCGHFFSRHEMDLSAFYEGAYVDGTYGDADEMRRRFERIIALPRERSDNAGRVARIRAFAEAHFGAREQPPTLLDVGSGLAVFPYAMKAAGWRATAMDPDPRAAAHAREAAGVEAVEGDFMAMDQNPIGGFDVITFNKVLEHVEDPAAMLARGARHLNDGGFVYVELPDGESAAAVGPGCEEFFIEHHHVFSPASTAILARQAGFFLKAFERLREPSGKFTLRAFLVKP